MGIDCTACGEEIVEGKIRAGVAVCDPCAREWDEELAASLSTPSLRDDYEAWCAATNTNVLGFPEGY